MSYYNLILALLESERSEWVDSLMTKFETLVQQNMTIINRLSHDYLTAVGYNMQPRLSSKMKGFDIFGKVADMEVADPDISFSSTLYVLEILFSELISLKNPLVCEEIECMLFRLAEKSLTTSYYIFHLKSILMMAKLHTIEGEIVEAKEQYNKAKTFAQQHILDMYLGHIEDKMEKFRDEVIPWMDISKYQQSIIERINASMIRKYLSEVEGFVAKGNGQFYNY